MAYIVSLNAWMCYHEDMSAVAKGDVSMWVRRAWIMLCDTGPMPRYPGVDAIPQTRELFRKSRES
jgi:hypothetical protein